MQTVRITRRAKQRARRHTHKHNQRGGAAWAPVFASEEDVRFKDWKAEIDGNEELKALFPSLQLLDRNKATTDEEKQERLLTYFNCMAHQDKLFRAALNIIRKKVAASLNVDSITHDIILEKADAIDAQKPALMEYFRDVERMVSFTEDKDGAKPKMRQMYTDNNSTLSTLLLFPSRVDNIFIMALSEIICNLIEESTILRTASNKSIIKVLATQYDSYVQALAHTLTAFPLRDGFNLNQSLASIEKLSTTRTNPAQQQRPDTSEPMLTTFWDKFVETAKDTINISDDRELFKNKSGCANYISDNAWSDITANMACYAKINKETIRNGNITILAHLSEECKDVTPPNPEVTPDSPYNDVTINGVPLKSLLSNANINILEFLLHLEVAIKECLVRREHEEAAAITPSLGE